MSTNPPLTMNQRTALALNRFKYERQTRDGDGYWIPVEDHAQMYRVLANSYMDPGLTIRSMQTGLQANTPFVVFRAIPVDGAITE